MVDILLIAADWVESGAGWSGADMSTLAGKRGVDWLTALTRDAAPFPEPR